jgi:hypothetical protein
MGHGKRRGRFLPWTVGLRNVKVECKVVILAGLAVLALLEKRKEQDPKRPGSSAEMISSEKRFQTAARGVFVDII